MLLRTRWTDNSSNPYRLVTGHIQDTGRTLSRTPSTSQSGHGGDERENLSWW